MQSIRRNAIPSVILVFLILAVFPIPSQAVNLMPGDKAPGFSLKDIDGNRVTLEQFRGKTVVIAFWSTWCSRCEEEISFLRDTLGKRGDVAVLLINQDSENIVPVDRIRRVQERMNIKFPVLIDEGLALWEKYGINALPTSVVVDGNGKVKLVEPNFFWGSPDNLLAAFFRMETTEHFARVALVTEMLGKQVLLSSTDVEKLLAARVRYGVSTAAQVGPTCPVTAESVPGPEGIGAGAKGKEGKIGHLQHVLGVTAVPSEQHSPAAVGVGKLAAHLTKLSRLHVAAAIKAEYAARRLRGDRAHHQLLGMHLSCGVPLLA